MFWRVLFFTLLTILIAGICLYPIFLERGIINTKDLPPWIGSESGTLLEYVMNVWHLDIAGFFLFVLLIPLGFVAAVEPSKQRKSSQR